ncbi:hypothetical protein ACFQGT_15690 [Natrialbaceae archaeon GCM10025810]|uniref:hypothetical protein n=1 Tax=Halovalidus salilacus TaxID=3075124 RepID=UPI00360F763B
MALIVDGIDDERTASTARDEPTVEIGDRPHRIDVSDLPADGIESFVRSNVTTDRVSLEHCGGRTYLVLEE